MADLRFMQFNSVFDDAEEKRAPIVTWLEKERIFCMTSTPGGRIITAGDTTGDIAFWDSRTGTKEYDLSGHTEAVLALHVVPEMNALFSAGADSTIRLWNLETLQNTMVFEGHRGFIVGLFALVLDTGTGLFSGSDDRTVKQWNSNSGACVHTYKGHKGPVNAIFSTETHMISGSSDGVLKIWDINTRKCVRTIEAHTDSIWCITQLADGRLVTGSTDETIRIWDDVYRSATTTELRGHRGKIRRLLSCGPMLFSAGADAVVHVWDTRVNTLNTTLRYHTKQISGLTLENNQLCSCGFDKTVCRWDVQDLLPEKQPVVPFQPLSVTKDANANQSAAAKQADAQQVNYLRNQKKAREKTPDDVVNMYPELPVNFVVDALQFKVTSSRLMGEVVFYIPFLICFVFVFMLARPIEANYYMASGIEGLLTQQQLPSFKSPRTFDSITTADWWYTWMTLVLTELWREQGVHPLPSVHGQNILVGALRVRQQRVSNSSCGMNQHFFSGEARASLPCYGGLSSSSFDTAPLLCPATSSCTAVDQADLDTLGLTNDGFLYSSAVGVQITGQLADYEAGGYHVDFNFSEPLSTQLSKLESMKRLGFVDEVATRFVDVSFYVYNPSIDLFVGFLMMQEVPYGGTWLPTSRSNGFEVFTNNNPGQLGFQLFFFFFVLGFIILLLYQFISELQKGRGISFILDTWNVMEAANLFIFIVMYGYLYSWMIQSQKLDLTKLLTETSYSPILQQTNEYYQKITWYNAVNTILTFLKLLKYVRLNDRLNILTRTLSVSQQSLLGVLVLFVYVVLGFALTANGLYGVALFEFRTVSASYIALLRALIGDVDYDSMVAETRMATIFFFWAFQILGQFILLNFLVAVISDGFHEVSQSKSSIPLDQTIIKAFKDAKYEFLPKVLKWKFLLLRHRYTQTSIISESLDNLLEKRNKMVDAAAAQRQDFDEVEDVLMRREDFEALVPKESRELIKENRLFIEEVWKDMAWEYHHKQLAEKGQEELEREVLVYEEVEQALRGLTAAFPVLEQLKNRLEVQEAKLRPLARSL